jgi:tetratricopeptide (TPR) repeat protein
MVVTVLNWPSVSRSVRDNVAMATLARVLSDAPEIDGNHEAAHGEQLLLRALDGDASNRKLWRVLGYALAAQGKEQQARDAWTAAGQMGEELLLRGVQSRDAGQHSRAVFWHQYAAALRPDRAAQWYQLALDTEAISSWEEALQYYERALAAEDLGGVSRSHVHFRMGGIYQDRLVPAQPADALSAYESALQADDFSSDEEAANCHFRRCLLLRSLETPDAYYIDALREALAQSPSPNLHVELGRMLYKRDRDTTGAEAEILKALALHSEYWPAHYHLGHIYAEANRLPEALRHYERAVAFDPTRAHVWYRMGLIDERQKAWHEALRHYERATTAENVEYLSQSRLYFRMGLIYQDQLHPPHLQKALSAYESALNANDFVSSRETSKCHYRRGLALKSSNAPPASYISAFQTAIALHPRAAYHTQLAVALFARDGDVDVAVKELRKAIALEPENKWANYELGKMLLRDGRVNDARQMFQRALEIDPQWERPRQAILRITPDDK